MGLGVDILGMTSFALLFTLSCLGIAETVYLIRKRLAAEKPFCPIGGCEQVLTSKYSKMFIIPNDVLGLMFYIAAGFVTVFLFLEAPPDWFWLLGIRVMVGFGAIFSIFLTYLQWRVIKAWCFWCLMSALTTWLMGLILLI